MAEIAPARAGSSGKHFGHVEEIVNYVQKSIRKIADKNKYLKMLQIESWTEKRIQNHPNMLPKSPPRGPKDPP